MSGGAGTPFGGLMILGTEDGMPVGKPVVAVGIEAEGSARMLEPMG